jgi:uncharacterized protein YfaS (alpha-2-macroglobulin family)
MLRSRQNGEGAFGMWAGNGVTSDFATLYALQFLTEARERGYPVPQDLLGRGLTWARGLASGTEGRGGQVRLRAYAFYLLARNGQVMTRELAALRETLDARTSAAWTKDLTAIYLAATYALLKQEGPAARLIDGVRLGEAQAPDYPRFYDGLIRDAQLLDVLARHFPGRLGALPPDAIDAVSRPIAAGSFNTLSAAYAILALDAYAQAAGAGARQVDASVAELLAEGKARPLVLPGGLFPRVPFGADARGLRVASTGELPIFWQAVEAGFDATVPATEVKSQLEIFRELRGRDGKVITSAKLGDELEVHVRIRSLGPWHSNVAVVDLLPGGFEPILEERTVIPGGPAGGDTGDGPGDEQSGDEAEGDPGASTSGRPPPIHATPATVGALPIGLETSTWRPEYADVREDRVVLYGLVGPEAREFVYRIKATNRGTFTTPPPYAESMYDRAVRARGLPGQVKVGQGD